MPRSLVTSMRSWSLHRRAKVLAGFGKKHLSAPIQLDVATEVVGNTSKRQETSIVMSATQTHSCTAFLYTKTEDFGLVEAEWSWGPLLTQSGMVASPDSDASQHFATPITSDLVFLCERPFTTMQLLHERSTGTSEDCNHHEVFSSTAREFAQC